MNKSILASVVTSSLLLSACAHNIQSSSQGRLEHWDTFNGSTTHLHESVGNNEVRVYFLREKGMIDESKTVNVYVNGDYLASLKDGGERMAVLCSNGDKLEIGVSSSQHFIDRKNGVDYNFEVGKEHYIRVAMDGDKPVFQRLDEEQGKDLLATLDEETQTTPRTHKAKACKKAVLGKITLQAHSLFKFDKSDYKNMLPKGREEIKDVGNKLNTGEATISDVKVIGYTDPQGSESYNVALSNRRAETVKKALQAAGVAVPIATEGLGEKNLVVLNCASKYKGNRKARMECDQPNRRVEIVLYGQSKQINE